MATKSIYSAVGRRKSAVARIHLQPGKGKIIVNKHKYEDYFGRVSQRQMVSEPIDLLNVQGEYDIKVNVRGGGLSGQASAIRHGISRALVKFNSDFKPELKKAGFLTRDARIKERKKYGLRGARRAFQFSKR